MGIREGFYKVVFNTDRELGDDGIIVIEGDKVRGADGQYLYSGSFSGDPERLTANITIASASSNSESIFGMHGGKYMLDLTGTASDNLFQLSGTASLPGSPVITIRGTWIAGLAL